MEIWAMAHFEDLPWDSFFFRFAALVIFLAQQIEFMRAAPDFRVEWGVDFRLPFVDCYLRAQPKKALNEFTSN